MNVASTLLNRLLLLLGAAGIFISGVLSLSHLSGKAMPCTVAQACDWVASRPESKIFGVPVAAYGFLTYVVLYVFAALRVFSKSEKISKTLPAGLVVSGLGTLFSGYLMYLLLIKWQKTCPWCMASAGVMVLTFMTYGIISSLDFSTFKPLKFDRIFTVVAAIMSIGMINSTVSTSSQIGLEASTITQEEYTVARLVPKDYYFQSAKEAPVTLIEYADFMCPACRVTYRDHEEILKSYPGKIRFAYRNYPLVGAPGHEMSLPAAVLSEIAAEKGRYWEAVDALFSEKTLDAKDVDVLIEALDGLGLDKEMLKRRVNDENDPAVLRVSEGVADATRAGITGTPTYVLFLPGAPGRIIPGAELKNELSLPEVQKVLGAKP